MKRNILFKSPSLAMWNEFSKGTIKECSRADGFLFLHLFSGISGVLSIMSGACSDSVWVISQNITSF